ncbi:MAG: outer membrane beta-barrel protein [Mongoliitalea sp.]
MKKLLVIIFFLPLISFGQFAKGTKYLGGDILLNSSKIDFADDISSRNNLFSISSQLGFFLNDSWAIGPAVNFSTSNNPSLNPVTNLFEDRRITGYAGGLFARKFFSISENFFFSLEGKGLIGSINREPAILNDNENKTRFRFSLSPIFTFMPTKKWAFDARIGEVSYESNWNSNISNNSNFRFNFGSINLGFNYFFRM